MLHHLSTKVLFATLVVFLVLLGGMYYLSTLSAKYMAPIACTADAKICPDGSAVGRTGPKCEFAPCPNVVNGTQTFTDIATGISFSYPEKLPAQYIYTIDWPPKVQLINQPFSCTPAGSETGRAGKTESLTINGHPYCVTKVTEGAAGSIYTQYAYAFPYNSQTVILTFSLRFVQCGNYSGIESAACQTERASFNIDTSIDSIVQSIKS